MSCPYLPMGEGETKDKRAPVQGTYEAKVRLADYPGLAVAKDGPVFAGTADEAEQKAEVADGVVILSGKLRPGETHAWFFRPKAPAGK